MPMPKTRFWVFIIRSSPEEVVGLRKPVTSWRSDASYPHANDRRSTKLCQHPVEKSLRIWKVGRVWRVFAQCGEKVHFHHTDAGHVVRGLQRISRPFFEKCGGVREGDPLTKCPTTIPSMRIFLSAHQYSAIQIKTVDTLHISPLRQGRIERVVVSTFFYYILLR